MAITLDSLRESIEKKYTANILEIDGESIVLRNPMRMSKGDRKQLVDVSEMIGKNKKTVTSTDESGAEVVEEIDVDEDELIGHIKGMLRILIGNDYQSDKLFVAVDGQGDDAFAMYVEIMNEYNKSRNAGESSASAS